jgi:hypothetical protein
MRVTCDFGLRTRRGRGRGVTKLDGMVGNPGAAQAWVALNMWRYDLAAVGVGHRSGELFSLRCLVLAS